MDGQKRPYCPQVPDGYDSVSECSSTNPETWFDFETCAANQIYARAGIFAVKGDDIVIVDIDDYKASPEIQAITENIPRTYAEYSWSGNPENRKMHIFVRGKLPANFKAPGIEAYQEDRYMGVTGKAINGAVGITEQQQFLDWLWSVFGSDHAIESVSLDPADLNPGMAEELVLEKLSDKSIWDGTTTDPAFRHPAGTAKAGCWNSDIEAAMATRFAMITDDPQIILRLMAASPVIREMADYAWHGRMKILNRLVRHTIPSALKSGQRANHENEEAAQYGASVAKNLLANMSAKADTERLDRFEEVKRASAKPAPSLPPAEIIPKEVSKPVLGNKKQIGFKPQAPTLRCENFCSDLEDRLVKEAETVYPDGLVGAAAQHIYGTAYYPMAVGALFSALTMCGGIFSNRYYFRNSGLNLYCVLTAAVGDGKDDLINIPLAMLGELQAEAAASNPDGSLHDYYTGYLVNGTFTSKKAVLRQFTKKASLAIMTDEIGKEFTAMLRPNAGAAKQELKAFLLNAYGRSGPTKKLDGTTYANEEDDANSLTGRSLSMFGVTNPASFRDAVQTDDVADGFFARFLIADDNSSGQGFNPNEGLPMDEYLRWSLATACNNCPQYVEEVMPTPIGITPNAEKFLIQIQLAYKKKKDEYSDMDMRKSLISRAAQNINRVAAIVATGKYFWNPPAYPEGPVVHVEDLEYGLQFVAGCVYSVFQEVKTGVFDPNSDARILKLVQIIQSTITGDRAVSGKAAELFKDGFIDRNFLMGRLGNSKCWRAQFNYGRSKPALLDQALKEMVECNYLAMVGEAEKSTKRITRSVYKLGDSFDEALELLKD